MKLPYERNANEHYTCHESLDQVVICELDDVTLGHRLYVTRLKTHCPRMANKTVLFAIHGTNR